MSPWSCPFCGVEVDSRMAAEVMARRLFESHLDVHMARHDELLDERRLEVAS